MAEVYKIEFYKSERRPDGVLRLYWDGDEGWGQYDILANNEAKPYVTADFEQLFLFEGYSEYMDRGTQKDFLCGLLNSIPAQTWHFDQAPNGVISLYTEEEAEACELNKLTEVPSVASDIECKELESITRNIISKIDTDQLLQTLNFIFQNTYVVN